MEKETAKVEEMKFQRRNDRKKTRIQSMLGTLFTGGNIPEKSTLILSPNDSVRRLNNDMTVGQSTIILDRKAEKEEREEKENSTPVQLSPKREDNISVTVDCGVVEDEIAVQIKKEEEEDLQSESPERIKIEKTSQASRNYLHTFEPSNYQDAIEKIIEANPEDEQTMK